MTYAGFDFISSDDPLFVHQFTHAWFDFRNRRDRYADYFANSILATRAHKAFCLNLGKPYSDSYWGISASDSQHGYTAWGGPSLADSHTPPTPQRLRRHRRFRRPQRRRRLPAVPPHRLPANPPRSQNRLPKILGPLRLL